MAVFLRRVAPPPPLAAESDDTGRGNAETDPFREPWRSVDAATGDLRRRIREAAARERRPPSRPAGLLWPSR
jgi:hypothetical protein